MSNDIDDHNHSTYVTTEHEGLGSRIQNSLGGLCFGPLLVLLAVAVLCWNEGRNVHRFQDLQETRKMVHIVSSYDSIVVDDNSNNNHRLVYLTGSSRTDSDLYDEAFGLHLQQAVKYRRIVETYQWVEQVTTEQQKTTGGGQTTKRTYDYHKEWKRGMEHSQSFHSSTYHQNPDGPLYQETEVTADPVRLGPYYTLSNAVTSRMNWFETVTGISADTVVPNDNSGRMVQIYQNKYYYFGNNPSYPQVGDTRVRFEVVKCGPMSIIAAQQQKQQDQEEGGSYYYYSLVPYDTSRGGTVLLVEQGVVSVAALIAHAEWENTLYTWGFRALGVALSYFGLLLVSQPLTIVLDIVPCLGDLVGMGMSCLAFGMAMTLSATVIAMAWLFYRPVISGAILLAIGGTWYLLSSSSWKRSNASPMRVTAVEYPTTTSSSTPDVYYDDEYAGTTSPHYPQSYQNQYVLSSMTTPFAQVLDTQFAHQTSTSPALDAPVLMPPIAIPVAPNNNSNKTPWYT
jgi:Transmembrane protein 43